jgi:hypothetical protein
VSEARPPAAGAVCALLVVTALGTLAYWVGFFAGGEALHSSGTDVYRGFEHAFPAADAWMAAAAVAAAIGLRRRRPWATAAGVACGSALVFLGLLDVTFNLEQRLYAEPSGAMAAEIIINAFCMSAGPFFLWWFWRYRSRLGRAS